MTYKIAHLSDIHFRSLKRHDEYKQVFKKIFAKLKEEKVDCIFIGGDIVHSKTQGITPEIIDVLNWWFTSLAEIAPTHIILGNHDGLILNKNRQDAISPIISALDNKNLFLYKKSGVYPSGMKDINWCVFSCFDEENWNNVKPVKGKINIAAFHGAVWGSKTDIDWELEGEVNLNFFDGYDFAFLGDIHKKQYLDKEKRVAYPGSTIQQNFGEDIEKGFLIWEITNTHDYKSRFIKINNDKAHVTIDWQGDLQNTVSFIEKVKSGVRFRIRSSEEISQAEIKILHHYLKNEKNAEEIVYQNLSSNNFEVQSKKINSENNFNIRNKASRKNLLKEYYCDALTDDELDKLDNLFEINLDKIPSISNKNQNKWSINSLKWDNTFSYGKGNEINFNKLNGIVGLFGNNRSGKSSIPGTLMYSLFNTTDRGTLKNLDIVNIRKGECQAVANITVGTDNYNVIRKTVKKTNKKGITSASTKLHLEKLNHLNEVVNESEEQRRETDKILQDLIGTSEDFLYTSFASQGEINTFIKEKSSARKSVLSKFLNLNVFDDLYKNSREQYIVLKNRLKDFDKEVDILNLVKSFEEKIETNNIRIDEIKKEIACQRKKEIEINVKLNEYVKNNKKHPSGYTIETAEKEILYLNSEISNNKKSLEENTSIIDELKQKLEKINFFKNSYSIQDLEQEEAKLESLKEKLNKFNTNKKILSNEIQRNNNELRILDEVPCGDQFSSCRFIKNAHFAKNQNPDIQKTLEEVEVSILEIRSVVNKIESENIKTKIKKYKDVLNKEYRYKLDIENLELKNSHIEKEIKEETEKLQKVKDLLLELESFTSIEIINKEKELKTELKLLTDLISSLDNKVYALEKDTFYLEGEIEKAKTKDLEYQNLVKEWKIFDIFSNSVSKKGIPSILINNCLPIINKEINNILGNTTSFKISIEYEDNNNLNIYIDYGDSKRVIECASGMEKMMTSIAIRVALINISNLPKSDLFIIDEGFGALDANNVEACSSLLTSIKKYFKTILIISHVDSIKDIVDKNIEINLQGNNSYVKFS